MVAAEVLGPVNLRVLTRSDPTVVESMIRAGGLDDDLWSLDSIAYSAMPEALSKQDVGLHFLPTGLSELGGSPTKIGEYWAVGLPVVVTPNAGDVDEIVRQERVGVIVNEHSVAAYRTAAMELRCLLQDSRLEERCRRAAETHYGLEVGCGRLHDLYRELTSAAPRRGLRDAVSEGSQQ
jgi:glycosyltransferase involved in cell wall biosynthesis